MADSPWSSLRTRCWWYRLSSVVAVFALASWLHVRHWQSCGSQLWYRQSTFAYHMRFTRLLPQSRCPMQLNPSIFTTASRLWYPTSRPVTSRLCVVTSMHRYREMVIEWKTVVAFLQLTRTIWPNSSKLMVSFRWTATWGRKWTNSLLFADRMSESPAGTGFWVGTSTSLISQKLIISRWAQLTNWTPVRADVAVLAGFYD